MENNQEFCATEDRIQSQTLAVSENEDTDQINDSDESNNEENGNGMNEERDDGFSGEDSAVDEELEAGVEKTFARNSRLQQLLQMNESYKSSNSLFKPNLISGAVIEKVSPELKSLGCSECAFTTQHSEELERHLRSHKMSAQLSHPMRIAFDKMSKDLHKCHECEEWFTTDHKLQTHINKAHNKAVLNCIKCEFTTREPKEFLRHCEQHMDRQFHCSAPKCNQSFRGMSELKNHSVTVHLRDSCDKSDKSFKQQSSLVEHRKKCHTIDENYVLECPVCDHTYNCRTRYEKHVKSHDVSNRFHCRQCDQSFDKEVALEVHLNKDHRNGSKPFVCVMCGQEFYANEKLLNHLSNKHKMAVYECESCAYKTNSKYKMARHKLIHSSNRYKCDIKGCYLVFETKYNLTLHKKNKHSIDSKDLNFGTDLNIELMATNSDHNSDNSFLLRSASNSCSDSFEVNVFNSGAEDRPSGDDSNNQEFVSMADFLEIDLKSGDNEEDVILLDDSSDADTNGFAEKQFECTDCQIIFESEAEYESHINEFHMNCDINGGNLSDNPILGQILDKNEQIFGQNSKNFSIVYNKNKNSLLINQNCGKTNVKTINNSLQSESSVAVEDISQEEDIEEEEEEDVEWYQRYCQFDGCQEFFSDEKAFNDHIQAVHRLIRCNKCEKCFQSFSGLYKHKRRYHRSGRQIVCRFCDKTFFYQMSYKRHIESHGRPLEEHPTYRQLKQNVLKTYSCYECNELFAEKEKYLKHLSKIHSIPSFECELCDYKSVSKKLLTSHLVRHSTEKPYKCDINDCNMRFKSRNSLQIHKRVKHLNQWGNGVPTGQNFDDQQLSNVWSDGGVSADDILHSFDENDGNTEDIQQKESINCLISGCDLVFDSRDELNQHMKERHDITLELIPSNDGSGEQSTSGSIERRFVCETADCGKQLATKQALEYHISTTHTGVKPYVCQWSGCDYRTVIESRLKLHMRTHTNPLQCPITGCAKVFPMNIAFKRHLKTKHKNFENILNSSSDLNQFEDSPNDSDMSQSYLESNIVSIDGQNFGFDNVKQEPTDDNSEDRTAIDQNMDSMDYSTEYNQNFSLITEYLRKTNETPKLDNSFQIKSEFPPSVDESTGYWEQNSSDFIKSEPSCDLNLLCFECNESFGSYDLFYRHNNEFHNKYKPKYK